MLFVAGRWAWISSTSLLEEEMVVLDEEEMPVSWERSKPDFFGGKDAEDDEEEEEEVEEVTGC